MKFETLSGSIENCAYALRFTNTSATLSRLTFTFGLLINVHLSMNANSSRGLIVRLLLIYVIL